MSLIVGILRSEDNMLAGCLTSWLIRGTRTSFSANKFWLTNQIITDILFYGDFRGGDFYVALLLWEHGFHIPVFLKLLLEVGLCSGLYLLICPNVSTIE